MHCERKLSNAIKEQGNPQQGTFLLKHQLVIWSSKSCKRASAHKIGCWLLKHPKFAEMWKPDPLRPNCHLSFFQDCIYFCYQQDHFGSSLRRCGRLGSSFGCKLLNGKQTICSQDGNDHLHCNDRHRGSYYWSQLHPALPPPQWGEIHKIHRNTQMHKITILSKCFSKIESGSACSTCTSATAQMVWAQESALQLSDTLCYKVKSKSEEAKFSRAKVLMAPTILSTSLKAQAHITKQGKAMHVKCEQIRVRFGEKIVLSKIGF